MLQEVDGNGLLQTVNYNFDQLAGPQAGTNFYVDGNAGDDDNDGLSWGNAFATLAVALAASHADIAADAFGWTSRNRIYFKDDENSEDLVKLADKTDVIGVGSYDRWTKPRLLGNHVIAGSYMGTRFFNCYFKSPAAGGDIWTLPTTLTGIGFFGNTFDGGSTTPATGAIIATALGDLVIKGNVFKGEYTDAVIELAAGASPGLTIEDNVISGADDGIQLHASFTTTVKDTWIARNFIRTTEICINDLSGLAYIVNNRVVTLNAKGTAGAGAIVGGAKTMLGNLFSASDVANCIHPANGAI